MQWTEWFDVYTYYDFGEVLINGVSALTKCASTYVPPTSWQTRTLDLTPHIGQTVEVSFNFAASKATNRAGWYIDSLAVTGS